MCPRHIGLTLRHLPVLAVFFPTYTPPEKMNCTFFCHHGWQNSAESFIYRKQRRSGQPRVFLLT